MTHTFRPKDLAQIPLNVEDRQAAIGLARLLVHGMYDAIGIERHDIACNIAHAIKKLKRDYRMSDAEICLAYPDPCH